MPKKSTGCYRCRRRKVKCDEGQPACRRCLDLGMGCPGYRTDKDVEFRDQTVHYSRKAQTASSPSGSNSAACSPILLPREQSQRIASPPLQTTFNIDTSYEYKASVIAQFFNLFLPGSTNLQSFTSPSYLLLIKSHEEPHYTALFALALAHVGTYNNDLQLMDEARLLYSVALQRLWQELPRSHDGNKDSVVTAINLLSECEELQATSSGSHGLSTHLQGARKYFLHWFESNGSDASELLYFTTLLKLLLSHLSQRTHLCFDPPAWLRIRRLDRDPFNQLLLLLSPLPGILSSIDQAFSAPQSIFDHDQLNKALKTASVLRSRLDQWLENMNTENQNALYESIDITSMSGFYTLGLPTTFHTAFSFPSYRDVSMLTVFWIGMMILNWNVANALKRSHIVAPKPHSLNDAQIECQKAARHYAIMVCQSLPFFWEYKICGFQGRIAAARCLRFVHPYFANAGLDAQYAWCSEILGHLQAAGVVTETEHIY